MVLKIVFNYEEIKKTIIEFIQVEKELLTVPPTFFLLSGRSTQPYFTAT